MGRASPLLTRGIRKVVLNFAPVIGYPINASVIRRYFDPDKFLIKLTPLNPTVRSSEIGMRSVIEPASPGTWSTLTDSFTEEGLR